MTWFAHSYVGAKNKIKKLLPTSGMRGSQESLKGQFLEEWENHRKIAPDELLRESLQHAVQSVPFYRDYFDRNPALDPCRLTDWPVLTRDAIWDHGDDLRSIEPSRWRTWTHASGGSTGKPVAVVHDEYFAAKASALRQFCGQRFFKGPHYNQLILWGMSDEVVDGGQVALLRRLKDRIRTFLGLKTSHINTFEFSAAKFAECVRILRDQKPRFIFGYAGSVYELAKYLDDHQLPVPRKPAVIGTTAQTLHPFMREKIEAVFGCSVVDHYGSREAGPLAWQHEDGAMYFPRFFAKIEVVDEEGVPVEVGQVGRILVTTLHNFGMPLIRYDIGDTGRLGEDVELDGYAYSTLRELLGRQSEEFVNPRGSKVCGPFFINLFYYRPWLDQFYIVQKDYDLIEIQYVLKEGHTALPDTDKTEINGRIATVMTPECRVVWRQVADVPTTSAGKRLFIRSEVAGAAPQAAVTADCTVAP